MTDLRIKWMGDQVLSFLGLENFDLFINMLESNENQLQEKMLNFMNSHVLGPEETLEKLIFYVHRTYYDKLVEVEKEITEWRIVPPTVKIITPPQSSKKKGKAKAKPKPILSKKDSDNFKSELETIADESKKEDYDNAKENNTAKGEISEDFLKQKSTDDSIGVNQLPPSLDPEVEGTIEYYTLKRFVPMMMKLPKLDGNFGFENFENCKVNVKFIYFIRLLENPIPQPSSESIAKMIMPKYFMVGCCDGQFLKSILLTLKQSYIKFFELGCTRTEDLSSKLIKMENLNAAYNEFEKKYRWPSYYYKLSKIALMECQDISAKFKKNDGQHSNFISNDSDQLDEIKISNDLNILNYSIECLNENIEREQRLTIPNIPELNDKNKTNKDLANDTEIVEILAGAVKNWCSNMASYIEHTKTKDLIAGGPVVEYEFWSNQNASVTKINDQLQTATVRQIIDILKLTNSPIVSKFEDRESKLNNYARTASNNLRLLSTSLEYFKIVTECSDLKIVGERISGLVYGLSMLWMLSKYYCNDERMIPLLESTANCLCRKIEVYLAVETLFSNSYNDVHELSQNAQVMLKNWKDSYMKTRQKIEITGKGSRWEFDVRKLFQRTDYLANVCDDLAKVAKVLIEFENILGDEIKTLTLDQTKIKEIYCCIHQLIYPIKTIDFSVFIPDNKENWDVIMNDFYNEVDTLENKIKSFIDTLFNNLQSSEEALEMLSRCMEFETRPSIHTQLKSKYDSIWEQFSKEICIMHQLFNIQNTEPPLLKNHPSLAGAVFWSWAIKNRASNLYNKLQKNCNMDTSEKKALAYSQFSAFSTEVNTYYEQKFSEWINTSIQIMKSNMKNNVFKTESVDISINRSSIDKTISKTRKKKTSLPYSKQNKILNDKNIIVCNRKKIQINFDRTFFKIVDEMGILEYLGFGIPTYIKQCGLHSDLLHYQLEIIEQITNEYNKLLRSMTDFEIKLVENHLHAFEQCLMPGIDRITWSSLGLDEFIERCTMGLNELKSINRQVEMIKMEIENLLYRFQEFDLFPNLIPAFESHDIPNNSHMNLYHCETYFIKMEESRTNNELSMIEIYKTIGLQLLKLEYLILETNTGQSIVMLDTYNYWETKIHEAFIEFSILNMKNFNEKLQSNQCIFQVDAILQASEVVISPLPEEIYKISHSNINDFLSRFKNFRSWTKGTCKENLMQYDIDQVFQSVNFYNSIMNESKIEIYTSLLLNSIKAVTQDVNIYIQKWSKFKLLWSYDKRSSCEKYTRKYTEIIKFDERFSFFENIIDELSDHIKFKDIGCIRINLLPIIIQVQTHACEWKKTLGQCLILTTKEKMVQLSSVIMKLSKNLNINIKKITDYKLVSLTINQIKSMTISVEIIYKAAQEVFYMLKSHNIEIDEGDMKQSKKLQDDWHNLYISALFRFDRLSKVKEVFSDQTSHRVQEFSQFVENFTNNFNTNGPGMVDNNLDDGLVLMQSYSDFFQNIEIQRKLLQKSEKLFTNLLADYTNFLNSKNNYDNLVELYEVYKNLKHERKNLCEIIWNNFDMNVLVNSIDGITKDFRKISKNIKDMPCGIALKKQIDEFKSVIPLLELLKNESVKPRHWKDLMAEIGKSFDKTLEEFTLKDVFELELNKYRPNVESVVAKARKEATIETDIKDIRETWEMLEFTISHHIKDGFDRGFTISSYDKIITTLEDHQMNIQIMKASQHIGLYLNELKEWDTCLSTISEVLEQWIITQNKWLYLESIFIGSDIRSKLPIETNEFDILDNIFIKIMNASSIMKNVKQCCLVPELYKKFTDICLGLDKCQRALLDYADTKRRIFSRFFFISNDELLSILGKTDPAAIQEYINKMFNNINKIKISENEKKQPVCNGLISNEEEILEFKNSVQLIGYVEDWMNLIINEMVVANRLLTKKSIYEYGTVMHDFRIDWILNNLGVVSMVSDVVWWTAETEYTFRKLNSGDPNAMKKLLEKLNERLKDLVLAIRKENTLNEYKKLKSSIIVDIHAKDIIENFVMNNVMSNEQFEWESQLRFYWMKHLDNLQIKQCTGEFEYGYEYIGLCGRLVITPLTDRIYLTITQALTMHLGTAPAGPAGTGKTETVKDLAKSLGILCMVTNCGENLNYQMVAQIFSGLCSCGAWGCFDEFNRIDISVLSVVSTQLYSIKAALTMKLNKFIFEGTLTKLQQNVGIFITMNPGYAGRAELPESLKVFFRPVMCIVPDIEVICQISLLSDGFLDAKILSKKISILYQMARDQLSKQSHYDWGLRSLVALLRMAGILKRSSPKDLESEVLLKALRNINQPKFIVEDIPLFINLVKDIFPGCEYRKDTNFEWETAIVKILNEQNYTILPYQIEKTIQLYDSLKTQHSVMLVGSTGGGKSTIIQLLVKTLNDKHIATELTTLNPKAVTVNNLYGTQNLFTREWTDGLLSSIFRKINGNQLQNTKQFILFDGDVDALWIENMNSVMDDNKILTLANGERIQLAKHCLLLFEVGDLIYASPATVSRAGMIYIDPESFSYKSYWQCWVKKILNLSNKETLEKLFDHLIPRVVDFMYYGINVGEKGTPMELIISHTPLNSIIQFCNMLDALIPSKDANFKYDNDIIDCTFIVAIYYSFGAVILEDNRKEFDDFIKTNSSLMAMNDTQEEKSTTSNYPTLFPTLYDYYLDIENKCWNAWEWLVPKYEYIDGLDFPEILVPTVDTLRINWMISMMQSINKPFLLTGDRGSAKTAVITNFIKKLNRDTQVSLKLNFTARTTSMDILSALGSKLEKRAKHIMGPPVGKKLIIFIDDMNLPEVDQYGTQMPIAFLKLAIEKQGYYELEKDSDWKTVQDIHYISAMGKSGGRRHDIDPRLISKYSILNLAFPSEKTLKYIFLSILSGHFQLFNNSIQEIAPRLIQMTLKLFQTLLSSLPPTPSRFHYIFDMRELSRIIHGMTLTQPSLFPEPKYIVRAWRNEFNRVICDRLICKDDLDLIKDCITSQIMENFGEEFPKPSIIEEKKKERKSANLATSDLDIINSVSGTDFSEDCADEEESVHGTSDLPTDEEFILRDPILFGDFRNALNGETRYYEDLLDYDAVYHLMQEAINKILEEYNDILEKSPMVLFEDCLEHLTRIQRVIRMRRSHMLLIGPSCSGKNSMIKLAAFAAGAKIFEIIPVQGYDESSFKEDLKQLFNLLGIEKKRVVFLASYTQIVDESLLDLINNMLVNGIITSIFTDEEKDFIINICREDAIHNLYSSERDAVWEYFCNTCANNLNIVFTSDPSEKFRKRCSKFPGLISCTTINWLHSWPEQALLTVANSFLSDISDLPEQYKEILIQHIIYVHQSADKYTSEYLTQIKRYNHVTPYHYITFITNFLRIFEEKKQSLLNQCQRFENGILKIDEANNEIVNLNSQLETQKKVLEVQNSQCSQLQNEILQAKEKANTKKEIASRKTSEILEKNEKIIVNKKEAEIQLAAAEPAVKKARSALQDLDKADITEIRSFATPPEDVQVVAECILIVRGYKELSWKVARGMMSDPFFLKNLQEMNFDEITPSQIKSAKIHMKGIKKKDIMQHVSKAGYGLLTYLNAILEYCQIFQEVKPKRDKVIALETEFNEAKHNLEKLNNEILNITDQLKTLNIKHKETMKLEHELREKTDQMVKRLTAADKLINGLSSEKNRWKELLISLQAEKTKLIGNCLLSSAFLNYLGPFTFEYRCSILYNDWSKDLELRNIPISSLYKIETYLTNDVEISKWNSEGLPSDEFSIQNGILTIYSRSYPLCIDPQSQAITWIKNKEINNSLKIISLADPEYLKIIQIGINVGQTIVIQDVTHENINPILYDLFAKNIKVQHGRKFIKIGSLEIDYNPNFRLYLTTKHNNPKFTPTQFAKLVIINYLATFKCLEEQLLRLVISNEKPELETQCADLIKKTSNNKSALSALEDHLLIELSMTTDNILDNDELVEVLDNETVKVEQIKKEIELSSETADQLNKLRLDFMPVATRGAIMFFTLLDMTVVNYMYQYSLTSYFDVFLLSLKGDFREESLESKLNEMIKKLTYDIFEYCCTGLFDQHKVLFAFQLTINLEKSINNITQLQLDFLIKGSMLINEIKQPCDIHWLPIENWNNILSASTDFPELFSKLPEEVLNNSDEWEIWFNNDQPEKKSYPNDYTLKLKPFESLLLLRCFRIDRMHNAIKIFIEKSLGSKYNIIPTLRLRKIYEQTTAYSLVVFILSSGCDPMAQITQLAKECGIPDDNFKYLSLGQGQEGTALNCIQLAIKDGHWLILQNCQLLPKFLIELETIINRLHNPNPNFRLWLTTEPTKKFPVGILQRAIKVVFEAPSGLKSNLRSMFTKLHNDTLDKCDHYAYKKVIYALSFFHAVIQERKKYDKIGWNIPYDFNESDQEICFNLLEYYLNKVKKNLEDIPWETLKFLFGEIMYGGRVSDSYDRRILKTYIDEYFGDFLFDNYQQFTFYTDKNNKFTLPPDCQINDYIDFIDNLPNFESPEIFGLHSNCEILYQTNSIKEILNHLINMQAEMGTSTTNLSKDGIITNLAQDILAKIPQQYDLKKVKKQFEMNLTPSSIVLLQELERFNKLTGLMHDNLNILLKALAGETDMSLSLENMSNSLYMSRLPDEWIKLTPQTAKTLSGWMEHFTKRNIQYESWATKEEPLVIWLSGLHVPESLLVAHMQIACRMCTWPLETCAQFTDVTEFTNSNEVEKRPKIGCYLSGLYLEGAEWDVENKCLITSHPKILFSELPIVHVVPIKSINYNQQNYLPTPVYLTSLRRNAMGKGLVFESHLKINDHCNKWILQGVCIIMNTN